MGKKCLTIIGTEGPLAGLTQLILLDLHHNSISILTALAGLTQLRGLSLHENAISDLTPLGGLTQLTELELHLNSINDIAPLVANPGLGAGDFIDLSSNPLNTGDCANLQTLIDRGANVSHDVNCP